LCALLALDAPRQMSIEEDVIVKFVAAHGFCSWVWPMISFINVNTVGAWSERVKKTASSSTDDLYN
jgi:hypothetical protein